MSESRKSKKRNDSRNDSKSKTGKAGHTTGGSPAMEKARTIIPTMANYADPLGSYTGVPINPFGEIGGEPAQDADDL